MVVNCFLDLDGVMVDLDKKMSEVFDKQYSDKNYIWQELGKIDHLFLHLDPMPNYTVLFNYLTRLENSGLIHLEILTSLPWSTNKLVTSKQDKIDWVRKHLSKTIPVNTVTGGAKKAKYVTQPTDILIDDLERNVQAWTDAGGTGIHFINNASVIAQLDKILVNKNS